MKLIRVKMNKTVIVFCKSFAALGGTETLTMRLLIWYAINNYRSILLTLDEVKTGSMYEELKKNEVEIYTLDNLSGLFISRENNCLRFQKDEEPLVINNFLPEFFRCISLLTRGRYGCKFRHTVYIVHPFSTRLVSGYIRIFGKMLINNLISQNVLIFMDNECVDKCMSYYKLDLPNHSPTIYRLPMNISKTTSCMKTCEGEDFNILTISRFEFPFKGYVFGLVDAFSLLARKYEKITLTIIGYGKDQDVLMKSIEALPNVIKNRIFIHGEMPYSQTLGYIKRCDVYVGMGTSVLDAANEGKIAILASAYQMSCFTAGYFHERHDAIGDVFDKNSIYSNVADLIENVINISPDDYEKLSVLSKKTLKNNYNISDIAPSLFNCTQHRFTIFDIVHIRAVGVFNLGVGIAARFLLKLLCRTQNATSARQV